MHMSVTEKDGRLVGLLDYWHALKVKEWLDYFKVSHDNQSDSESL